MDIVIQDIGACKIFRHTDIHAVNHDEAVAFNAAQKSDRIIKETQLLDGGEKTGKIMFRSAVGAEMDNLQQLHGIVTG